jgi:hypothetical protein
MNRAVREFLSGHISNCVCSCRRSRQAASVT